MAKTLKAGETFETPHGGSWDAAILVVDRIYIDYLAGILKFNVQIYKDAQARDEEKQAYGERYEITRAEFLANFQPGQPISSLKTQTENYALTLTDEDGALIYNQFE